MKYIFLLVILLLYLVTSVSCESYACQINHLRINFNKVFMSVSVSFVITYMSLDIAIQAIRYFGVDNLITILTTAVVIIILTVVGIVSYLIK